MQAHVGDQLIVLSPTLDRPVRDGEILEIRGAGGEPPFLVRWSDNGRTTLVFPGPDARVHHLEHSTADIAEVGGEHDVLPAGAPVR